MSSAAALALCSLGLQLPSTDLTPRDLFGQSLAAVGDWDRDGTPDLAVGDPLDPQPPPADAGRSYVEPGRGAIWIVSGRTGRALARWNGGPLDHGLGITLAAPGDLDDDGFPDLVAGIQHRLPEAMEPGPHLDSGGYPGAVRAIDGRNGETIYELETAAGGLRVPWWSSLPHPSLAQLGDLDGDGASEFAVGTPNEGASGVVRIVSGRTGRVLRRIEGESLGDGLGVSVARLADLDEDGVAELVCSAMPACSDAGRETRAGHVLVISGRTGDVLRYFGGPSFGAVARAVGDLDGDRYEDLVVASPFVEPRTRVALLSARSGAVLERWSDSRHAFGAAIAVLRGTDSRPTHLVVGVPESVIGGGGGDVRFLALAHPDRSSTAPSFENPSSPWDHDAPSHLGVCVENVGNLDDDGVDDVAVGAAIVRGSFSGAVLLLSGRSGSVLRTLRRGGLVTGVSKRLRAR